MKKSILAVIAIAIVSMLQAKTVPQDVARIVAQNFWNIHRPEGAKEISTMTPIEFTELPHLYIFATDGTDGFVIMPTDDRVEPILAYSFDMPFPQQLNPELRYWLRGYESQIAEFVELDLPLSSNSEWLTIPGLTKRRPGLTAAGYLCRTHWDQGSPYNNFCPYDSTRNQRTVVGCVATAMAQVMKYWNHPVRGTNSHSYTPRTSTDFGTLSADFYNTSYLYDYMPNGITTVSRQYEIDAIALLSYHAGVSVNMMYGVSAEGGSGAFSNDCITAFRDYFGYSSDLHMEYRSYYDSAAWETLILSNINSEIPIYYTGRDDDGGHAFILDGSDTTHRFHFNWGWNGYGDGFYRVSNLNPGGNGIGGNSTYTFNQSQSAIFDIHPIPMHIDSVTVVDTFCSGDRYFQFYEHNFVAKEGTYTLPHLDTIFTLILGKMNKQRINLNPNGASGSSYLVPFCPAAGIELPECTFSKPGYRFVGWNERLNGNGAMHQPGEILKLYNDVTFYATWRDTTLGINNVSDIDITIYPNPVAEQLNISLPTSQPTTITIYDATGRIATTAKSQSVKAQISLAGLPAGVYIVRVASAEGTAIRHIIKE